MRYEVTLATKAGHTIVTVDADSGDEAASKAHKPGTAVIGVHPAPAEPVVEEAPEPVLAPEPPVEPTPEPAPQPVADAPKRTRKPAA